MPNELTSIQIRYDGLDAERHTIDLMALGESMQGVARILAVVGHFAATRQYAKQMQALDVRVMVQEPRGNCFSFVAVLEFAKQHQLFAGGVMLLPALLSWIFTRASNNKAEMKAIKDSLDKAVAALAMNNSELTPKLLATIERMAESLRPAVRSAVAPVGRSCTQMRIGEGPVVDQAAADAIRATAVDEVTEERNWTVLITELDLENRTAKVRMIDGEGEDADDRRFRAVITDPALTVPDCSYLRAFSTQALMSVRGKATLREGDVETLYISDGKLSA